MARRWPANTLWTRASIWSCWSRNRRAALAIEVKSSPTLKITTPRIPSGMPWWVTQSIDSSDSRRSSESRRTVCTPGMTSVPLPVTILNPRLSDTASLGVCSRRPEMMSASLGSATRHISLKMTNSTSSPPTTAPATIPPAMVCLLQRRGVTYGTRRPCEAGSTRRPRRGPRSGSFRRCRRRRRERPRSLHALGPSPHPIGPGRSSRSLAPSCQSSGDRPSELFECLGRLGSGQLGLQLGQLRLDLGTGHRPAQLRVERVPRGRQVIERPRRQQLVDGPGPGLDRGRLVLRPLHGQPDVAHLLREPRQRLADLGLRLGGGVGGLDRLLADPEGVEVCLQLPGRLGELRLLGLEGCVLGLETFQVRLDGRPAGERFPGQILLAERPGPFGLFVELRRLGLQLLALHLQPLAGGGDIEQAPFDLLVHLQLALVRVVQPLAGIFHLVEGFVGLGLEEHGKALPETHAFNGTHYSR